MSNGSEVLNLEIMKIPIQKYYIFWRCTIFGSRSFIVVMEYSWHLSTVKLWYSLALMAGKIGILYNSVITQLLRSFHLYSLI